jgi:ATP-binding cassette subfamily F protein 3
VVKALLGELELFDGDRILNPKLRTGVFTQHHADSYDLKKSAVELMAEKFPEHRPVQDFRQHLGAFGLSGNLALRPMYLLSGGQKSRLSFAMITWCKPHVLILDEPTNHLDYDAINALIKGLKEFKGGLVVVSHDEYFLTELCDRLYLVEEGVAKAFEGDLSDYRKLV